MDDRTSVLTSSLISTPSLTSTSSTASKHLATFTLFPSLPIELRLKIYDHIISLLLPSKTRRILRISYNLSRYLAATAPLKLLRVCHESRFYTQTYYKPLLLGDSTTSIPISFSTDTLYLSSLRPLLPSHLNEILYHFSSSPCRHAIQSLAIDLRCWSELCDNGFLSILASMKGLKELLLVVEFGRVGCFRGELSWLDVPVWRGDIWGIAERADVMVNKQRSRVKWNGGRIEEVSNLEEVKKVGVRCTFLTRGGEQA